MEKNIVKMSYLSIIGFICIIVLRLILNFKILNVQNFKMRKIYAFITYGIYLPFLLITSLATILVLYFYFTKKNKAPLKYLILILPSLIYMIICVFALFGYPK